MNGTMIASRLSRSLALLLSLVPGWGHIYLGREAQGLALFTIAALGGFALLNAAWIYIGPFRETILAASAGLTLTCFLFSIGDVIRLTSPARMRNQRRLRDQLIWHGMLDFLRADYAAAEEKFLECSRLDTLDVEPVFRSGVAAARRGARREARRRLARARRLDHDLKWHWEIEAELERLERPRERPGKEPPARPAVEEREPVAEREAKA